MVKNRTLLVDKTNFSDVRFVDETLGTLSDGSIRVCVGPWALTANNVTYMVTGNRIGYWHYFDPKAYAIGQNTQNSKGNPGRMPVWGFAEVTESRCDGIEVGQHIYGFFPITKYLDIMPVKLGGTTFQDGREHRVPLHSLYNSYTLIDKDPSFSVLKDLHPVLRPLFTTSFLIDDALADQDFHGATQVLVLSASSKTALGTAFCLKERGGIKVTALTSHGNVEFVSGTGFYDTVVDYDSLDTLDPSIKTLIVDMSGNGALIQALTAHFGNNLTYICRVGLSHWEAESVPMQKEGPKSEFFFAPDRAKQRLADWGGSGFSQKLGARWLPFLKQAGDWLTVFHAQGEAPVLKTYESVLDGSASPDKGYIFTL